MVTSNATLVAINFIQDVFHVRWTGVEGIGTDVKEDNIGRVGYQPTVDIFGDHGVSSNRDTLRDSDRSRYGQIRRPQWLPTKSTAIDCVLQQQQSGAGTGS